MKSVLCPYIVQCFFIMVAMNAAVLALCVYVCVCVFQSICANQPIFFSLIFFSLVM